MSEDAKTWIGLALVGLLIAFVLLRPDPPLDTREASPPDPAPVLAAVPEAAPAEADAARAHGARQCEQQALRLLDGAGRPAGAGSAEQELEAHWIRYLHGLQAAGRHDNWTGPPCELYVRNRVQLAREAIDGGRALLEVRGNGLESVTVRATLRDRAAATIVVPAGTLFASPSGGIQDMVAAGSTSFVFAPAPIQQDLAAGPRMARVVGIGRGPIRRAMYSPAAPERSISLVVPAYCANRWRAIPDGSARFEVVFPEQGAILQRLVSCLQDKDFPHELKQRAVWLVTDELTRMSPRELEERILEDVRKDFKPSRENIADFLKKADPDLDPGALAEVRNMPAAELEQARAELWAALEPKYRADAAEDVKGYVAAGRLLQSCGIDRAGHALFR